MKKATKNKWRAPKLNRKSVRKSSSIALELAKKKLDEGRFVELGPDESFDTLDREDGCGNGNKMGPDESFDTLSREVSGDIDKKNGGG